jgi:5,10-methylenetetrahydromethanopterin reductase
VASFPKLSVRLHGGLSPAQCVAQAQAAEAAGFHAVWFAENPFARGILPAAAACAAATQRLGIGAGVFNPFNRHPTLIAMEIGALDELAGGRVRLGIGSGIGSAVERMGFSYARPLTALAEAIAIVRGLLAGAEVTHKGDVFSVDRVRLDYAPRRDIAIFMAGRGDRSLALCGERADGLLVSNMCTAAFVARSVALMQDAARRAGRSSPLGVVRYMPCCIAADRAEAILAGKRAVGEMLPAYWRLGQRLEGAKSALLMESGITEPEFAAAAARLRAGEDAGAVIDERFVQGFAIAGTPADCAAQISACGDAGVTELALTFSGEEEAAGMRRAFEILANLPDDVLPAGRQDAHPQKRKGL